jgi:hypothetical protein
MLRHLTTVGQIIYAMTNHKEEAIKNIKAESEKTVQYYPFSSRKVHPSGFDSAFQQSKVLVK